MILPTSPRHATTFMTWTGVALAAHPKTRHIGAWMLLVNGLFGAAIGWERAIACDMSRLFDGTANYGAGLLCVARHAPQLAGGAALMALAKRAV